MRISDWSSDVCSSDLAIRARDAGAQSIQFSTPVSGLESTGLTGELLGGAAATPFGAYGINAANALTAGTLDEIVGATGGNAQAAQLAKDLASKPNPGASIQIGRASCRERVCKYV